MDVVIIGAGAIGLSIASVLSKKNTNVILVDLNEQRLEYAANSLDVATKRGSGTNWLLLDELVESNNAILLALTGNDESNLVACCIAKSLGYKKTIARIQQTTYLNRNRIDFERMFHVDHFVCPELHVAQDMANTLLMPTSTNIYSFANGAITMRSLAVPSSWKNKDKPLSALQFPPGVMLGLIRRKKSDGKWRIIFPHGKDHIEPKDEVTFIGETPAIQNVHHFFQTERQHKSVFIVGTGSIAQTLAKQLQNKKVDVHLATANPALSHQLAEKLPDSTILYNEEIDIPFLESEQVHTMGSFIACTENDEQNIILASLARHIGCKSIFVAASNPIYEPLIDSMEATTLFSPRNSAANRILSVVGTSSISSIVSLHEGKAEIMELQIALNSAVTGIPLSSLGPKLPKDFLIGVIQNRGRIMVASGNKVLCPGDTVIAISSPKHANELSQLF